MKLSAKIILPIILISALLILLTGCFGVPADESPGFTTGTITGIIAAPCCENSVESADGETDSPEFWCYYCLDEELWKLQNGVEVVLTYGDDEVDTTTTNQYGEYTFTDVDPGKNYVITAYCPNHTDDRPLVKDVALEIIEGGSFDTKITDLVSTSLGLVVDFLVEYSELGPEDIELDEVIEDKPDFPKFPKFKKLIRELSRVLEENCGNVNIDGYLQDALCLASQEIGRLVIPDLDLGCIAGATPVVVNYTLTTKAAPPAGGTVTGSGIYSSGTVVTITATATTGYHFVEWTGDTVADANSPSTTILMNGNKTVTANFTEDCYDLDITIDPVGSGSVAKDPLEECYLYDEVVTLTPIPAAGWTFDSWSGLDASDVAIVGTGPSYTITMDEDKEVTANFTEDCYDLDITIDPVGSGSVAKDPLEECYLYDEVVTLTPIPAAGWTFDSWSGLDASDVAIVGTGPSYTITMDEDKEVTANFTEDCYDLDITIDPVGSGSVAKDPLEECYLYDEVVTLTPIPAAGWTFDSWSGLDASDVAIVGTGPSYTITMDEDKEVTANFTEDCYDLDITIDPVGSGSVAKDPLEECYLYDEVVTLTPIPAAGWTFDSWSGLDASDVAIVGTGPSYTITMDEDKEVTANFTEDCYDLDITIDPVGSGSVAKDPLEECYLYDEVVTLTPIPAAGWTFDSWSGLDASDVAIVGTGPSYTITMDEDKEVTANFTEDCYDLDITIDPVGSGSVAKDPLEECYLYDEVVTLTPIPAAGWTFDSWSGLDASDVAIVGTGPSYTITMDEDKEVTANFTEDCYDLDITIDPVGSGSVAKDPLEECYLYDEVVTLTPIPAAGWTFDSWSGLDASDVAIVGTGPSYTITMDEDKEVTANFTEDCYDLDITIDPVGSGSVAKDPLEECYLYDEVVTLTPIPAAGWTFDSWSGLDASDVAIVGTGPSYTITMDEDKEVTANFAANTGCLLVKVYNPEGSGYGAGWVKLFNSSMTFGPYDTAGNGWYTFTNIPVGTYTLMADGPAPSSGPNKWIRPSKIVTIVIGTVCQEEALQYIK